MTKLYWLLLRIFGGIFGAVGLIPIGIIYLIGYLIGMKSRTVSKASSADLGLFMIAAPLMGVVTVAIFLLVWFL